MPEPFNAVGLWYDEFSQTTDDEVARLLAAAARGGRTSRRLEPARDPVDLVRERAPGR